MYKKFGILPQSFNSILDYVMIEVANSILMTKIKVYIYYFYNLIMNDLINSLEKQLEN